MTIMHGIFVQQKQERSKKRAKLAAKTKLSFAEDNDETADEEVSITAL